MAWPGPFFCLNGIMWLQRGPTKCSNGVSIGDIEDLIHNFLIIMLEHSMRQKDGWKVSLYWYSHNSFPIAPPQCWLKLIVLLLLTGSAHIILDKFFNMCRFLFWDLLEDNLFFFFCYFYTVSARYSNGTGRTWLEEKKSHIKHTWKTSLFVSWSTPTLSAHKMRDIATTNGHQHLRNWLTLLKGWWIYHGALWMLRGSWWITWLKCNGGTLGSLEGKRIENRWQTVCKNCTTRRFTF